MDVSQLPLFIIPALIFVATSFGAKFITVYLSSKSQGLSRKASIQTAFGSSASGGELALVTAKGGADVGATSAFVLPNDEDDYYYYIILVSLCCQVRMENWRQIWTWTSRTEGGKGAQPDKEDELLGLLRFC